MGSKRVLAIVHGGSFRGYPMGGIETFLGTVIPHLDREFEVKLIGMGMGDPLGRWTDIRLGGRSYQFLPVLGQDRHSWVPDRIQLMVGIARYADEVTSVRADAYYVHMTEAAIGLLTMTSRPIIVHVHGLYNLFEYSRYRLGSFYARLYERLYPQLFSRCAKVIGVGSEAEFAAFARMMRVRSGSAMPTCARTEVFYPRGRSDARKALGIEADSRIVLFVGRMTPTKNPRLLLETFRAARRQVPGLKVVFIGDGPARSEIAKAACDDKDVLVLGALPPEDVALWMSAADALAVVSKTEAFTSIAALEALSCGTPVIATPVSALPELIRENVNGAVSRDTSVEAYCDALLRVLAFPPAASSCVESVRSHSPRAVADSIINQITGGIRGERVRPLGMLEELEACFG